MAQQWRTLGSLEEDLSLVPWSMPHNSQTSVSQVPEDMMLSSSLCGQLHAFGTDRHSGTSINTQVKESINM